MRAYRSFSEYKAELFKSCFHKACVCPDNMNKHMFPKMSSVGNVALCNDGFSPTTKMLRIDHSSLLYNMDFRICDPEGVLWRKTENLEGRKIKSSVLKSTNQLFRVVSQSNWRFPPRVWLDLTSKLYNFQIKSMSID